KLTTRLATNCKQFTRKDKPMSLEENKALARQGIATFNAGDTERLRNMFTSSFVWHFNGQPAMNREQFLEFTVNIRKSFPDFAFTIEDLVAEKDQVVFRFIATGTHQGPFQGVAPTNKRFRIDGFEQAKITDGKISEAWEVLDLLGELQQLGIVP